MRPEPELQVLRRFLVWLDIGGTRQGGRPASPQAVNSTKETDGTFPGVRFLTAEIAQAIEHAGLPHQHHPLSGFLTLSAV